MSVRRKSMSGPLTLASVMMAAALTSGCETTTAGSATETAICAELRASLPTWSAQDTERSKREGANFLDVFKAVCGG